MTHAHAFCVPRKFKTDVRCTDEALTQFHYTHTNEDRVALIKRSIEAALNFWALKYLIDKLLSTVCKP